MNKDLSKKIDFKLPAENIICLREDSEIRQGMKDFLVGVEEGGIDYPIEIQGGGHDYPEIGELKIWYPAGDIFISWVITIHEIGHWRQGEADPRFKVRYEGKEKKSIMESPQFFNEMEDAAYTRGWKRFLEYCPEEVNKIEADFQEYKKEGKVEKFKNFEEFYNFFALIMDKWNRLQQRFEEEVPEEKGRLTAEAAKKDEILNTFFNKQEIWRVGVEADLEKLEAFIKKMAAGVIKEEY